MKKRFELSKKYYKTLTWGDLLELKLQKEDQIYITHGGTKLSDPHATLHIIGERDFTEKELIEKKKQLENDLKKVNHLLDENRRIH